MYELIVRAVLDRPWAILPEKLALIEAVLTVRANGGQVSADEIAAATNGRRTATAQTVGTVAIIPVFGTIHQHAGVMSEYSGGASADGLSKALREAMADPAVGSIVLDVDSPGGGVFGVSELADEIRGLRGQKPMVAIADSLMASAAYWIASQADEVWSLPGGQVGSIGVYQAHVDNSAAYEKFGSKVSYVAAGRYKVEGNDTEPLGDEARTEMQRVVDAYYRMFVNAVAKGRGVSAATVASDFGEGRVVLAGDAKAKGMIDQVGTLDEAIARAAQLARKARRSTDAKAAAVLAGV